MTTLFTILLLLAFVGLVIGTISPAKLKKIIKKDWSRKKISTIFGGLIFLLFVMIGAVSPQNTNVIVNQVGDRSNNLPKVQIADSDSNKKLEVNNEESKLSTSSDEIIVSNEETLLNNIEETSLQEVEKKETDPTSNINSQTENKEVAVENNNNEQSYQVTRVVDGDTVKVNINGQEETLRLIGINTPETVDPRKPVECFGVEASNKAKELLTGKSVKLEADASQGERDYYGRLLMYVFLPDGTNFNKLMISDGYAYEYTYNKPYKYQSEFKQAQKLAQDNKRGLWADGVCVEEIEEEIDNQEETQDQAAEVGDGYKWYVSSYRTAHQYYCETDPVWKGLSGKYLQEYNSEAELLKVYPDYTLHEPCQ